MVSQKLLNELKEIIKTEHGVEVDDASVSEIARVLVGYFAILLKIRNRQFSSGGRTEDTKRDQPVEGADSIIT